MKTHEFEQDGRCYRLCQEGRFVWTEEFSESGKWERSHDRQHTFPDQVSAERNFEQIKAGLPH